MSGHPHRLFAGFNGRQVEIHCGSDRLASQVRLRLDHLLAAPGPHASAFLRLTLSEPTPSCVELRDSAGRCVAGSLEHVLYFVRKWTTADFAAAHPSLLWLHAGAVAKDGVVVLLAGPAGAGKSTLVVRLLERGWRLFGDDVVPVDVNRQAALPLPFTPDVRTTPSADLDDQQAFVEQPKRMVAVPADRVAREPGPIGAIVFPAYDRDRDARPSLAPISVVSAAEALARALVVSDLGHTWPRRRRVPACAAHRLLSPPLPGRDSCCRRIGEAATSCGTAKICLGTAPQPCSNQRPRRRLVAAGSILMANRTGLTGS